ncbi:MAG: tRNA1(Val) (adenine(37)-N6)-methyltransferase [Oscillospiraceae bacterium]|nr:tRNA1(Val) (adenine(37)-N6)-methyltransferase [Oscillospiraceae bacterium]
MEKQSALWPGGPVFCPEAGAPLGTDSVLLADFVRPAGAKRGIDLGCASGILSLLLLWREPGLHMAGLELREDAAALARENLARNGLTGRGEMLAGDIREHRSLFRAGSFDLAVSNPPYFPPGSGALSPDPARAAARGERDCSLSELCAAAAWLLRTGGRFCLVHRPERLSELFCALSAAGLEPKRLRLVCPRPESAPNLVLVEARRGGKPGLVIEPALTLTDAEGSESAEVKRIYHREE